jgi:hypothetical protein
MASTGSKIFISYRREDGGDAAGRIRDWLVMHLRISRADIFMDVATISPGDDFMMVIERAIGQCRAMIVLISPSWVAQINTSGESFVRSEVETALEKGVPVIPLLVGGAQLPDAEQLPEKLRALKRLNAQPVRHESFDYDMGLVGRKLRRGKGASARTIGLAAVSIVLVVGLIFAAFYYMAPRGGFSGPTGPDSTETTFAAAQTEVAAEADYNATAAALSATATGNNATPTQPANTAAAPYSAAAPGSCDTGGGQWADTSKDIPGSIQCSGGALVMTLLGLNQLPFASFQGAPQYGQNFPQRFRVELDVSNLTNDDFLTVYVVGLEGGTQAEAGVIQWGNGNWKLYGFHPSVSNQGATLAQGNQPSLSSYHMMFVSDGSNVSYYINSQLVTNANDSGDSSNFVRDAVVIMLSGPDGPGNSPSTVTVQNFTFTPLA